MVPLLADRSGGMNAGIAELNVFPGKLLRLGVVDPGVELFQFLLPPEFGLVIGDEFVPGLNPLDGVAIG